MGVLRGGAGVSFLGVLVLWTEPVFLGLVGQFSGHTGMLGTRHFLKDRRCWSV
jgi:hypothetical protein